MSKFQVGNKVRLTKSIGSFHKGDTGTITRKSKTANKGWMVMLDPYVPDRLVFESEMEIVGSSLRERAHTLATKLDLCPEYDAKMYKLFGWMPRENQYPEYLNSSDDTILEILSQMARESGYGVDFHEAFPECAPEKPKATKVKDYWVRKQGDYYEAHEKEECLGFPLVSITSIEEALRVIQEYAKRPSLRQYVPAYLAVIEYIENEESER